MCSKVAECRVPIQGSVVRRCVECREPVRVSPSSGGLFKLARPWVLCIQCVMESFPNDAITVRRPTADQVEEVADAVADMMEGGP